MEDEEIEDNMLGPYHLNEDKVGIVDQVIFATLWVLLRDQIKGHLANFQDELSVPIDTWAGALPDVFLAGRKDVEPEIIEAIRGDCVGILKARSPNLNNCMRIEDGCLVLTPPGKILSMFCAGQLGVFNVQAWDLQGNNNSL